MPPTIVTVPGFSGAPWVLDQLGPLHKWPLRTMRLPEGLDGTEFYADFVETQVADLDRYVLVGDSFGAAVALDVATRRPPGLEALVLSGGFAASPVTNPFQRACIRAARYLPGPLYRQVTLRLHAASLASPHDTAGEIPWPRRASRQLLVDNTPHLSYVNRAHAALEVDCRDRLDRVAVPTLLITPSHDTLIGADAAHTIRHGIPDATEVVLRNTGHMLRFSHPTRYASAIHAYLLARVGAEVLVTAPPA